jgi:hypothetical protein
MRKLLIGVGVVLIIAAVAYASGSLNGFTRSFTESRKSVLEGHQGIPSCDTETGLANARAAIDNSPLLKKNAISALAISSPKTISSSEDRVECEGDVLLSDVRKGPISYSFTKDPAIGAGFFVRAKKSILTSCNTIDRRPLHLSSPPSRISGSGPWPNPSSAA